MQSLPQRPHLPPSLTRLSIANHVFLRSWVFHIFYECHSLRAAPRGDIRHTWDCALVAHPGNQAAGTGEVYKMHDPPERVCSPSTWLPEGLDLGRAQNSQPTGSVPLWSTGPVSDRAWFSFSLPFLVLQVKLPFYSFLLYPRLAADFEVSDHYLFFFLDVTIYCKEDKINVTFPEQ